MIFVFEFYHYKTVTEIPLSIIKILLIDLHNSVDKINYVAFSDSCNIVLHFINTYCEFCFDYHCEQMHIDRVRNVLL